MKIHQSKFINHPTKKGCLLEVAMCGKRCVPIISFFGNQRSLSNGVLIGKVNCKTCIKAMKSPKNQCESPL